MIERELLISMMSDAYGQGLKAGQKSAAMKDDPDFIKQAVKLFSQGLTDMLTEPAGQKAH